MNRFLSKDFLSGVMFIAFGLTALYFGDHLALGTPVRMGPGYVPHKLACIMLVLGGIISLVPLFATATEASRRKRSGFRSAWPPSCSSRRPIISYRLFAAAAAGWSPWPATGSSCWRSQSCWRFFC